MSDVFQIICYVQYGYIKNKYFLILFEWNLLIIIVLFTQFWIDFSFKKNLDNMNI